MVRLSDKLASKGVALNAAQDSARSLKGSPGAGRFLEIDAERIEANPDQPRREFEQKALEVLAVSIREHGLLEPLLVRLDGPRVLLVAGERRLRAARMAGLTRVPCTVTTGDPAILALIENLHRQDLTPLEEAEAYRRLQQERGFSLADLAQLAGKAVSTVSEILSLAKLPEPVKAAAVAEPGKFPQRLLVELAKVEPGQAEQLAQEASSAGLSAEKVRSQRPKRQTPHAGLEFRRAEIQKPGEASGKSDHPGGERPEAGRVDALFRRAEMLAGELSRVNPPGLNFRQRVLAGHSLRPLAQSCQQLLVFLQETALADSQRWTPELRARLLAAVGEHGLSKARAILGRELYEDGQPLHPSELAAQLAMARQEAQASTEDEGNPGDLGSEP